MLTEEIMEMLRRRLDIRSGDSLSIHPVTGGSINQLYAIELRDGRKFFLKVNDRLRFPQLFQKEKAGLQLLSSKGDMKIPEVLLCEEIDLYQLLLLQWIEAAGPGERCCKTLGSELARMHQVGEDYFGLDYDNYIGSLPQENEKEKRWVDFFVGHRLLPQLKLAMKKGLLDQSYETNVRGLLEKMDGLFDDERSSLLHGDLWQGNYLCGPGDAPFLVDPAVYFGHRSMDLGMTTLFGGFDRSFYEAYAYHFPLSPHYREQWELANLYPLLVHLNLFGLSYRPAIDDRLRKYA